MDTRNAATEYRLSQWAQIMREKAQSGLTAKEFYEKAGISENVYYYWQRKLREKACKELPIKTCKELPITETETSKTNKSSAPNGWMICKPKEAENKEKPLIIEISGCRVMALPETNPDLLLKVCRMLVNL